MKRTTIIVMMISLAYSGLCQEIGTHVFVRTPQFINYNFATEELSYTQAISVGMGVSYDAVFLELAAFLNSGQLLGYYTFFGTQLSSKRLDEDWRLNVNWFGEVTYIPSQSPEENAVWTETTGISVLINRQLGWVNLGIPLCIGMAYSEQALSWNSRIMLNLSFRLNP